MIEADINKLPVPSNLNGSLGDRAYASIRQAILTLTFPPGAVIRKTAVCDKLGISRSPVSEALSRLSGEGLVDIVPQSGTRVSRLSMTALREEAFLRNALELAAVGHAALYRTENTIAKMSRNLEMQRLLVADVDRDEFIKTDTAFHEAIMSTTHVSRLPATVSNLSQQVERARLLLVPEPGRLQDTVNEHEKILAAIREKDVNKAQEAMHYHLHQLIGRLEPLEQTRPELFSS